MFAVSEWSVLSFIVPAYNEEFELPASLESIKAAAQDRQYEIIVVDDASTDATAEIAKQAGATVVPINRRQIAAARNAGARMAKGEIFFFVDADTRISDKHVQGALAALESGFSGGSARIETHGPVPWWGRLFLKIFSTIYFAQNLGAGAFLFTTRANFEKAGTFDERYFAGEEVWLSLKLKKFGRFKILDEPIITSGRKMRMYSGWQLWGQGLGMIFGLRSWRSRKKLDLWYDGKRETSST